MEELSIKKIKKLKNIEYSIPIYTPRTTFNYIQNKDEQLLNEITLNFDPYTISILKNEFRDKNWKLNLIEFIDILKDHLINWQIDISNRLIKIVRSLTLLFDAIVLSNKNYMEWNEFKNYIIDKASVINIMKSKNEEIKNYSFIKSVINKKITHIIIKCIYIKYLNQIAWFQENSEEIFFANSNTGEILKYSLKVEINIMKRKTDKKNPPVYNARKAMLLDIIFIEDNKYNLLVTSSNDGIIRMFRYSTNGFVPVDESSQGENEIVYDNAQILIIWDYINEILYSAQRNGIVNVWDQKSEPQYKKLGGKNNKNTRKKTKSCIKEENIGHNQIVTSLLPLPKLQFLASASLDKKIILWDTIKYEKKRDYKGYHKMGITCLDFNEDLILLISGGVDHEIYIWNPYIDTPVFNLSGHLSPLISLKFALDPLHIISLDSDSIVKIWNIKKFKCVDTFNLTNNDENYTFNPQSITIIQKPLKILVTGKNINIYEYGKNHGNDSSDENISVSIKYLDWNFCLLTAVNNKVKVWNLLTGEIKKIFSNLTEYEISVMNLDYNKKRFLLGDINGNISVHNVNNGACLKKLKKMKSEITQLFHAYDQNSIFAISIDNQIRVYSDNNLNESELIKEINLNKNELINIYYYIPNNKNKVLGHLGISKGKGSIIRYEILTGKSTLNFKDENDKSDITCIDFIDKVNITIYCNILGKITFLISPPIVIKNYIIGNWLNIDKETNNSVGIIQIYFEKEENKIYFFDEKSWIKCIDISKLINRIYSNIEKDNKLKFDPVMESDDVKLIWEVKAYYDNIKVIEIVKSEDIIITSGNDRKVKIFNMKNGNYLERLVQKKDDKKIKPVAYKKIDSEEIYSPRMTNRIDNFYIEMFKKKNEKQKEMLRKDGFINIEKLNEIFNSNKNSDKIEIMKEFENHEFDPFYYYINKINKNCIINLKSKKWKLNLNFKRHWLNFDTKIKEIIENLNEIKNKQINKDFDLNNLKNKNIYKKLFDKDEIKKNIIQQMNIKEPIFNEKNNSIIKKSIKLPTINKLKSKNYSSNKIVKFNIKSNNYKHLSEGEKSACIRLAQALYNYDSTDNRVLKMFSIKNTIK